MFICDNCLDRYYPTARQNMLDPSIAFRSYGPCGHCDKEQPCLEPPKWFLTKNAGPLIQARMARGWATRLKDKIEMMAFYHEEDLRYLPDGLAKEVREIADEYETLSWSLLKILEGLDRE